MKKAFLCVSVVFISLLFCMIIVKNFVYDIEMKINDLDKVLKKEEETLKMLKMEFAYLQNPIRLKFLCKKNSQNLEAVKSSQILFPQTLKNNKDSNFYNVDYQINQIKWRYINMPSEYDIKD